MKVAIVHDYLKEYGGAEKVLLEFHKLFPDAPIYTSLYAPDYLGPHKKEFENIKVKESFFKYLPFAEKLISPLRILAPLAFMSFDLSKYDIVIVSQTGAYFPNLIEKGNAKLICYTHTPPRYLYGYMTAREVKNPFIKAVSHVVFHFLRMIDFTASQNVDYFIANSEEVASRIKKFYRKEAVVINPPVDVLSPKTKNSKLSTSNYYLAGGRLARAKGIHNIIEAFNANGKKLKIYGRGFAGAGDELRASAHKNIEFLGEVTDEDKFELLQNAKAYIFASYDEDFGITPVEAMASGTPVIAYRSGGVQETVIDGKTGLFFDENTPDAIDDAIKKFEKAKISRDACRKQAEKFSSQKFDKKIKEFINKVSNA